MFDPTLNETFHDMSQQDNETRWFGQNENAIPIWILNQMKKDNRRSGIVGGFPGANVPFRNLTVDFAQDYDERTRHDWFKKVDGLVEFFNTKQINMGVLYFPEPDETGHEFGPFSDEVKSVLLKCDEITGYLIQQLDSIELFESTNIIITSDHGMDSTSPERALDLADYVDISKFKIYGGLTQINIFPNDRKFFFCCK